MRRSKSSSAVARTHSLDPAWGVRWAAASVAAVARACSWEMSVKSGGMCKFMPLGLLECLEKGLFTRTCCQTLPGDSRPV